MRAFLIASSFLEKGLSVIFVLAISSGCAGRYKTEAAHPSEMGTARETADPVVDECARLAASGSDAIPGWKLASSIDTYDRESLFDYIDGAAELYFAYDFRAVAAAEYQNGETSIMVDVYDMTTPENAFGVYSLNRHPEANYVDIGNEGILAVTNLDFWKGRYFCRIYSFDVSERYQKDVVNFGSALASDIQEAGEEPPVLRKLPQNGLISRSAKFFSRKLGLDNIHYVSEENIFNLNAETKGVIAEYRMDDIGYQLFIIEYPSLDEAFSAFEICSKYLGERAELLSSNKTWEMFGMDDKLTFVCVKDRSLWGFWDVEDRETAESILQNILPFLR